MVVKRVEPPTKAKFQPTPDEDIGDEEIGEVDAGQIHERAAELDETPRRDDRQHADARDEMAGEERGQEHGDDVRLDDGCAVAEAEAAGEHGERCRRHGEAVDGVAAHRGGSATR